MQIRPATRQGVRPLFALYGESGSGKTYSSLLLARGFAGPSGKIVMADTESGRGQLFADVKEFGGYEVLDFTEPFSPKRYIEAITAVEDSGAAIGILDSGSHEWEGANGVLDMAAANEEKSKRPGLHNWRQPKMEHSLFIQKLQRSTIPWIVCLRAKFKTRQMKVNGKTEIVKDSHPSPIQADDFIFEATVHGVIDLDHNLHVTKYSHPNLLTCLPKDEPLTLEHGRLLAEWCKSGDKRVIAFAGSQASRSEPLFKPDKNALQKELRTITESVHGWKKGMTPEQWDERKDSLEFWLVEKAIISDSERLVSLDAGRLADVIAKARGCL